MKRTTFAKALVLIIAVMVLYYAIRPLISGNHPENVEGFTGQTKAFETHDADVAKK